MTSKVIIKEEVTVKEIDGERLGRNPFIESLSIPVNKIQIQGQYRATKDILADGKPLMLPVEIDIEADTHCKVYNDARRRKTMVVLPKAGKELFLWLIYEVEAGKDYVWINKKRYMRENGIKAYNTYRAAIKDLIGGGFISGTVATDVYWVNPALFFCGSRKGKFPENIVRK